MISVITVYNNQSFYEANLLATVKQQNVSYELIALDNSRGTFKSAASALNYGATKATGDFLIFIHQDMRLLTPDTLEQCEKMLKRLPDVGIAGVIGVNAKKTCNGFILDTFQFCGQPFEKIQKAQTLDECLLIIPRSIFARFRFDEITLDGWHLYGVDYCLTVLAEGYQVYVLPLLTHHFSLATNFTDLIKYQKAVWRKHMSNFPEIHTTCGRLTKTSLLELWFKYKIINPWRSHPSRFFKEIYDSKEIDSLLVINPSSKLPDQHFSVNGKELFFADQSILFSNPVPDVHTILLVDIYAGYNRENALKIIEQAELHSRQVFISYKGRKDHAHALELQDYLNLNYQPYISSKGWKIFKKTIVC